MSTLFGTKIKDTYDGLLKVSDNVGITSTKKIIKAGYERWQNETN